MSCRPESRGFSGRSGDISKSNQLALGLGKLSSITGFGLAGAIRVDAEKPVFASNPKSLNVQLETLNLQRTQCDS
jgi:hypothetical protein